MGEAYVGRGKVLMLDQSWVLSDAEWKQLEDVAMKAQNSPPLVKGGDVPECYLCKAKAEAVGEYKGRELRWGVRTIFDPARYLFYPVCDKCWGERTKK